AGIVQLLDLRRLCRIIHPQKRHQGDLHVRELELAHLGDQVGRVFGGQRPTANANIMSGNVHSFTCCSAEAPTGASCTFCSPMPPAAWWDAVAPTSATSYFRYRFFIHRTPNRSAMPTKARFPKPYLAVPAKRCECLTGSSR